MTVWVGMEFWDTGKVILRERWNLRYSGGGWPEMQLDEAALVV